MFSNFGGFNAGSTGPFGFSVPIQQTFEDFFRCYPISMMPSINRKDDSNYGGKIFLPQTSLHKLTMLNIRYPMLFKIKSEPSGISTHSGVLEFTAEEGRCYLPQWMMDTIKAEPGSLVNIQTADLPQGQFVKLEPQSVDFLEISDPKAVLENTLRKFTTLTVNDIIEMNYNDQIYKIKVLEAKPEARSNGICIIETDLETDFAPPVGYVEPDYKKLKEDADKLKKEKAINNPSLKGKGSMAKQINYENLLKSSSTKSKFDGEGVKLSGKKVIYKEKQQEDLENIELDLSGPIKPLILPDGYLFFGYPVKPYKDEFADLDKQEEAEGTKVVFQGVGQSLRSGKKRKDRNKSHPSIKDKARSPETIVIDSD